MDGRGKIVNGYELIDFSSPNDITLLEIKNGIPRQQKNIKAFEKIGFSDRLEKEYFKAVLDSAKNNREKGKILKK